MILVVSSKKHGKFEFIVDDTAQKVLARYYWCLSIESRKSENKLIYAVGFESPKKKGSSPVRLLTSAPKGTIVDHINGNTLDNRLENLRVVNHTINMRNSRKRKKSTSKFKGVSWSTKYSKWRARLYFNKKTIELGYYSDEEVAALAYTDALKKYNIV